MQQKNHRPDLSIAGQQANLGSMKLHTKQHIIHPIQKNLAQTLTEIPFNEL